jgi:3-dehydroquinate dehydratase/shikimate dehydrogenase
MARAKNLQVIPGLEMFVQQGARQFEIWTGKPSPVAEMAYVVTKALERRAAEGVVEEPAPAAKKPGTKAAKAPAKKPVTAPAKKAVKSAKKR